jgi:hypothetical protein
MFGGFSRFCADYCSDQWEYDVRGCYQARLSGDATAIAAACVWHPLGVLGRDGPGNRWRHASASDGSQVYVFGGHRLWHGFSTENSELNHWDLTISRPYGGYLDDLWVYTPNATIGGMGNWTQVYPKESCFHSPGVEHVARFDIRCTIVWPPKRASATLVARSPRDIGSASPAASPDVLVLFGGYSSPYPYPHRNSRGAGNGTSRTAADGDAPYPSAPYYWNDVWVFNMSSGLWRELLPVDGIRPEARRGSIMSLSSTSSMLMFGGYGKNYLFNDLWIFNLTTTTWLKVASFVHPIFHTGCTSDTTLLPDGSDYIWSRSVQGQPTRFTPVDGKFGRASSHVFVQQPRRQAPGWDGCRDREDGRIDIPEGLQYEQPTQRQEMSAVFSHRRGELIVYGGSSLAQEELPTFTKTHKASVVGDMWLWRTSNCPSNCTNRGDCVFGHCYCYDGYYGVDCSNISCPGDYCYMDHRTHSQVCKHCCSATWAHADGEQYALREQKVPCDATHAGESHGICDGFGSCQCQPPFLTEDCSARDCPDQCNGRGYCSVEFPVSRCVCDPGWTGASCKERLCLNNCSWPNGDCIGGRCNCSYVANPYNRTMIWARFQGEDCSFIAPYAAASVANVASVLVWLVIAVMMWFAHASPFSNRLSVVRESFLLN